MDIGQNMSHCVVEAPDHMTAAQACRDSALQVRIDVFDARWSKIAVFADEGFDILDLS